MPDLNHPELKAALDQIEKRSGDDDSEKWWEGHYYDRIVTEKLAERAGFKGAREVFQELQKQGRMRDLSQAALTAYAAVARAFTEEETTRLGFSKLRYFLSWRKAAGQPDLRPDAAVLKITRRGSVVEKPLAECTVAELRAATASFRAPAEPVPAADGEALEALQVALDVVLGSRHPSSVKVQAGQGGITVTLAGVPLDQLDDVVDAWKTLRDTPEPS